WVRDRRVYRVQYLPLDARNHGYTVLDIQQDGPTIRYLIQK
ncbi:hypothetical protein ACUN90_26550, partial [Escherichia sp. SP-MK2]